MDLDIALRWTLPIKKPLTLFWVPGSLKARLLWASILLMPVLIVFAGLALQRAFENSLLASEASQARLHAYVLLGSAEFIEGELLLPRRLQEPRFSQLQSGLSGLVFDQSGELKWRSESSALLEEGLIADLADNSLEPGASRFNHLKNEGQFVYLYPVVWEVEGKEHQYLLAVLHSDRAAMEELTTFQTQLWGWLSGLYVVALVLQFLILRWGLRPLNRLAEDISLVEQGVSEKLEGAYPAEVEPVTRNLNRLIGTERSQRERYRNTLADLAHSLKTPLAVITGARSEKHSLQSYSALVEEQAGRMAQIVQYQLSRAVKAKEQTIASAIPLESSIRRITSALEKVYASKGMRLSYQGLESKVFAGDERDLMELMGNLLENAFKYGSSQVSISAKEDQSFLILVIEDDGPGVGTESDRVILQRGARLDTSLPGQGIGLAVCVDILSSYNGSLEVDRSKKLGGAAFIIRVPAATQSIKPVS